MIRYALSAALAAVLGLGGYAWHLSARNTDLEAQLVQVTRQLEGCAARSKFIIEDKESDDAIDRIPDHGLRTVPDHWMR